MSDVVNLDKRSLLTRTANDLWARWAEGPPRCLSLFAPLTDAVANANLRRRLASRDMPPDRPRVVSVGALATGGSGKTPVVAALCAELMARESRVALVTRGYGSALTGPCRVEPDDIRCGDEARMLADQLPGCVVVQSRDRKRGLAWLRDQEPDTEFVILEDGHQCAGAGRHLDILILDRWRLVGGDVIPEVGRRLPLGPYREGIAGASRADVWLVPLAPDEILPEQERRRPAVLGFRRRFGVDDAVATHRSLPYGVVCGIARPGGFEAACREFCDRAPQIVARFDDHHAYAAVDAVEVVTAGSGLGVEAWLTTAKDHVKLAALWPDDAPPLHVVTMVLDWSGERTLAETVLSYLEG